MAPNWTTDEGVSLFDNSLLETSVDKKPYKPNNKTLKGVIEYLDSLGIELMGQHIDLETGAMYRANMNYDYDDVLKLRELERKDQLWDAEE